MTYIRKLLLAFVLSCGLAPAFAQAPAPVPALPDTERRTSYSISGTTCACAVNFQLYGDSTDYQNWVEVFLNGTRVNFNDATFGWTITTPSGSLSTLARPITNAVLTFNSAQTGTVQIVGARRPRRTSQFNENAGVSAHNLNQVFTDIISQNRELWDKTNDVTGRALMGLPGESIGLLPSASARASSIICWDATGLIPMACAPLNGQGNVVGPNSSVDGHIAVFSGTTGRIIKDSGITSVGNVNGPVSSTDNAFVFWNGTSGTSIKNGTTTIDCGKVTYTQPLGGTLQTDCAKLAQMPSIMDFGAVGDGVTDDAPAARAAVAAVRDGTQVSVPGTPNGYLMNSCVNNAVFDMTGALANKAVGFIGQGNNLKSPGSSTPSGSIFKMGASIPDNCDFYHQAGTGVITGGISWQHIGIIPSGGLGTSPVGRHGFFFDGSVSTSFFVQKALFNDVFIDSMKTGQSFITTAQAGSGGGTMAHSIIENSNLKNASFSLVGDNMTLFNNIYGAHSNPALDTGLVITNCDGCTSFRILGGVFVSQNGMITIDKAVGPVIQNVEFESPQSTTNSAGYLINMRGGVATVINPVITGNSITQNSASGAYLPVKLDNVYGGRVADNFINVAVAAAHVTTTASTFNLQQGNNTCYNVGSPAACSYASGGSNLNRIDTTAGTYLPGGTSGQTYLHAASVASGDLTLPAPSVSDVLVGNTTAATLTNKSMSGSANTFTNIPNSALVNASTTVNGQVCTLGSTCTISASAGSVTVGTTTVSGGPGILSNASSGGVLVATAPGTGVLTALGVNVGTAGAFVVNGGALGSPSSAGTLPAFTLGGTVTGGSQNITGLGTIASTAHTITSASASALAVGLNGSTNPAFVVDASTASMAAGLSVKGAATGGTVAVAAIDSGSNTNLTINAKGTGTIGIGSVSTGLVTITPALAVSSSTASSSTTTGSIVTAGGLGIGGESYTNAGIVLSGAVAFDVTKPGRIYRGTVTGLSFQGVTGSSYDFSFYTPGGGALLENPTGTTTMLAVRGGTQFSVAATTVSTSASTGALLSLGGAGIAGALWTGTYMATTPTTVGTSTTSCSIKGARWFVTDNATALSFGAVITSGGAINTPIYCDGTVWRQGANDNIPAHMIRKFA